MTEHTLKWRGRCCRVCGAPLLPLRPHSRLAACAECRLPHIGAIEPRPLRIDDVAHLTQAKVRAILHGRSPS
jgi:hypothetical protein